MGQTEGFWGVRGGQTIPLVIDWINSFQRDFVATPCLVVAESLGCLQSRFLRLIWLVKSFFSQFFIVL